jgi:MFS transporter, ACS family, aldohexuronate transporter
MSPTLVRPVHSRLRWTVCGLLFAATTINYIDRQVLSMLAKTLQDTLHWTENDYADITAAFAIAYGASMLLVGRVLDKLGTRLGFALAIILWSVAAMGHALVTTVLAFGIARVVLGVGEAANFPACIKTVAEWFPKKERAQATGLFNAGANIGAVIAPISVPLLAKYWGWQWAFIITGGLGFLWLAFWLTFYHTPAKHPRISDEEFALITSDPPDRVTSVPWSHVIFKRETWAFGLGKFLSDPVWTFFLFWLPKYLQETFHLTIDEVIIPMIVVYNASTIGSVGGGWLSSHLIKRGWTINRARKTTMLICALCVVPVFAVPYLTSLWEVIAILSLALAAHQGWSANIFTTVSDMFPRSAVGSVVGIGGSAGWLGGALMLKIAGWVLTATGSYFRLFMICGSAYLVALLVLHLLAPRLQPVELN